MNNQLEKPLLECLLDVNPAEHKGCNLTKCTTCGFNAEVAARRCKYIKEHSLTLCADGLRRLIIKKEINNMAKPYKECPYCGAHLDCCEKCDCHAAKADGNAETEIKERAKNDN